ncbi:MAG: carboxypeptidase M32, partial [Alphaproteobacteria bacterium]
AFLRETGHAMLVDPAVGDLLETADARGLDDWRARNLELMRRRWRRATAIPADLVTAISRACSRAEVAWRAARPANDYAAVRPLLQTVLDLTREEAGVLAAALALDPYDALMDAYEPGLRAADCERIFGALEGFLPDLLGAVIDRQAARPAPLAPAGPFPVATQEELGRRLMATVGFDFERGRLDVSAHPFCGGTPDDIRITTRYDEGDFAGAVMAVLHETGHAMYEGGLPADWRRQPVGESRGMAVHESQSLIVEMQACRSRAFLGWMAPLARAAFGGEGPAWTADNLWRLTTRVGRGLIRVDADEVSYPLHVILRFRLERAMLSGDLVLADLPGAWNDGMRRLLGVSPPDDRRGCLQDIHWYDGAFGYFPTYSLGAMIAAQLFEAARIDRPDLPDALGRGDFAPLMGWLREHVHGLGASRSWEEIVAGATGRPLDVGVFRRHLEGRYLGEG